MVIQRSVCCHILTHGCETCQHQQPEHVCSVSECFNKEQTLPSFYNSTRPLLVRESVAVLSPVTKAKYAPVVCLTLRYHSSYHTPPALTNRKEWHVGWMTWLTVIQRTQKSIYIFIMFDKVHHICFGQLFMEKKIFLSGIWSEIEKCSDDWLTLRLRKPSGMKTAYRFLPLFSPKAKWSFSVFYVYTERSFLLFETIKRVVWCNRVQVPVNSYITK